MYNMTWSSIFVIINSPKSNISYPSIDPSDFSTCACKISPIVYTCTLYYLSLIAGSNFSCCWWSCWLWESSWIITSQGYSVGFNCYPHGGETGRGATIISSLSTAHPTHSEQVLNYPVNVSLKQVCTRCFDPTCLLYWYFLTEVELLHPK